MKQKKQTRKQGRSSLKPGTVKLVRCFAQEVLFPFIRFSYHSNKHCPAFT